MARRWNMTVVESWQQWQQDGVTPFLYFKNERLLRDFGQRLVESNEAVGAARMQAVVHVSGIAAAQAAAAAPTSGGQGNAGTGGQVGKPRRSRATTANPGNKGGLGKSKECSHCWKNHKMIVDTKKHDGHADDCDRYRASTSC